MPDDFATRAGRVLSAELTARQDVRDRYRGRDDDVLVVDEDELDADTMQPVQADEDTDGQ